MKEINLLNVQHRNINSVYVNKESIILDSNIKEICKKSIKIEVGGITFSIFSDYEEDLSKFIKEWRLITSKKSDYSIYLLHMTREELIQLINKNIDEKNQDFTIFEANDNCFFVMSKDRTEGWVINTNQGLDEWGMPLYERVRWHIATHLFYACEKRKKIAFHASAVVKNGKVVILFGRKATGKSTQIARLINLGWEFLSDDRVLISTVDGKIYMEPFWNSLKLRMDVSEQDEVTWLKQKEAIADSYYKDVDFGYSQRRIVKSKVKGIVPNKILVFLLNDSSNEVTILQSSKAMIEIMDGYILFGTLWEQNETRKCMFDIAYSLAKNSTCISMNVKTDKFIDVVNKFMEE